jgi:hypothetical protein
MTPMRDFPELQRLFIFSRGGLRQETGTSRYINVATHRSISKLFDIDLAACLIAI